MQANSKVAPSATRQMPDAFIILFFVVVIAAVVTHIVPAGTFATQASEDGSRQLLVAGTYQQVEQDMGVPLFAAGGGNGFFNFAFEGLVSGDKWGSAIGVIMFILITGGAFGIVMQTGAITNAIHALIRRASHAEKLFIPVLFVLFSLGGAVFGMGEEAIAFCIVLLPLMKALGYNGMITVMVTYVATQIGFATSWMNPFSVAIAQGIAQVPLLSGAGFRVLLWSVFTLVGLAFTMRYAALTKRTDVDINSQTLSTDPSVKFTAVDAAILLIFTAVIVWIIWGVVNQGYYIPEIASQFFTMGCVIGAVAIIGKRLSINQVSEAFQQGAKDLLPAALIVGLAKGIVILLGGDDPSSPSVLNTILHNASSLASGWSAHVSAVFMLIFQSVFNFFISSGSGQAALTMPLMAPLADLVGVSRQVAVLAFQLGDGFTNIIIPTSASLIGCLGVAKIDWLDWVKFIYRFLLMLMALSVATMITAVAIGF
ncbi:putative basic amino acid antiporter YfcC [Thalassotalea ponticola]|uniref:putative basic amino acid antiporter YfcC n=1 Tax=Thalassotalea ponticola TaxID=1523392 RepID=UPI0025B363E8|nr:putative basic amino acid antiporter YfcC [Thalassotalea ponticola]MDN3651606.1 putative basic amino acid antiporter YfcC [Thalassotalea ponticola]